MSILNRASVAAKALLVGTALVASASAFAQATPAKPPMSEAQVQEIVRAWIEKNPEVVLQAINGYVLAQKSKEAAEKNQVTLRFESELASPRGAAIFGNPEGKITMIYVLDAACGYCKQMTPALEGLVKDNPDLRIVHRWVNFLSPSSEYAERMALTVSELHKGVYGEFYKGVMSLRGSLTNEAINDVAVRLLGKDAALQVIAEVAAGTRKPAMDEIVAGNLSLAQRAGIEGTPTFIVQGMGTDGIIRGARPLDDMRSLIAKARALPAR